jgi:GNAT superfamily N-acetyltransferase
MPRIQNNPIGRLDSGAKTDKLGKHSTLPEKIQKAGISLHEAFLPGDLGQLVYIHGIQNFADYGFNQVHEAYCAKIAAEFVLEQNAKRSRAWLTKKDGKVVGSIFVVERPDDQAQIRLLFVDKEVRGIGLGRWLVQESVRYCRESGFDSVFLWTVEGLDRAASIYEAAGFVRTAEKPDSSWGRQSVEVRYELALR